MRVNIYLNENNDKDSKIIEFLESKYNNQAYIKELLYQLASGYNIEVLAPATNNTKVEEQEEYEAIIGIDDIDMGE
ncbi:MAG: hypothetical protein ACRC7N_11770 [Clostridium sp.]